MNLVHQAVPLASFHPLGEGRQHPFRPHRGVGVAPCGSLRFSGSSSLRRHCRRCFSLARVRHVSTFLHPFAPPALPGFNATMSALTPVPGLELAGAPQVSPLNVSDLRCLPSPTTSPLPMVALSPNPSAPWASRSSRVRASPFARRLTNRSGRIEFVILRTTSSPSVAPHPASRRRGYSRLQAGVGRPERDFHPSGQTRSRTHERATPVARLLLNHDRATGVARSQR